MGVQPRVKGISFVYVKNLVNGINTAIENPRSINETFFITDEGAYTWSEFGSFIEKSLGKTAISIYIPKFIVKIVYIVSALFSFFTKKQILLTRDKLKEMSCPYWMVSNIKIQRTLNFTNTISTEKGIQETIEWYRNNMWL